MADITMCSGVGCPRKESCYRFTAPESLVYQTYFCEVPIEKDGTCEYYWKTGKVDEALFMEDF